MSERHEEACRRYAKANDEVKRLTRLIGDNLDRCTKLNNGSDTIRTHLKDAYAPVERGYEYEYRSNEDIERFLIESGCRGCLIAHRIIQERKAERKNLASAKRWITKLGRVQG